MILSEPLDAREIQELHAQFHKLEGKWERLQDSGVGRMLNEQARKHRAHLELARDAVSATRTAVEGHLRELRMDTPYDESLKEELRESISRLFDVTEKALAD